MKKIIMIVAVVIALSVIFLQSTCMIANHERVIWKNNQPFCELIELVPDGTKMTVRTRVIDILREPNIYNHWWEKFNEGTFPST